MNKQICALSKRLATSALACLLCYSPLIQADGLTDVENTLVKYIDSEKSQSLALLEKVVNINSGTMNFAGVRQVGDIFSDELVKLGFAPQWIDGTAFDRAGHLFASRGSQGPKILMIGHLDTVFSKDSTVQKYLKINAHEVKGPGVIDMKGGDVIIISTLKALQAADLLDKFSIQVVMMGDEEKRGRPLMQASKVLIDAAKWADIAIGYENGDGDPKTAVMARRGYTGWRLEVSGKPAHSSQVFRADIGYGAIYEAARILDGFRTTLSTQTNLTFNPGLIVGGTDVEFDAKSARGHAYGKANVIAKSTIVSGDLRTLSPEQLASAQKSMQRIVLEHLAQTNATITFDPGYPPMEPTKGNRRLLSIYDRVSRDLGFGPVTAVDPRKAGAADISFTAKYVDMAIDGLGLMGHSSHTDDETADIRTLTQQSKRSALLMARLLEL